MDREWKGIYDWQWNPIRDLLPRKRRPFLKKRRKGGRPRVDDRRCFEAILWSARTGLPWRRLPERFGGRLTAARRLRQWHRSGQLQLLWTRFLLYTGLTERTDWRRRLDFACERDQALWRLELRAILDIEWPAEKRYT